MVLTNPSTLHGPVPDVEKSTVLPILVVTTGGIRMRKETVEMETTSPMIHGHSSLALPIQNTWTTVV